MFVVSFSTCYVYLWRALRIVFVLGSVVTFLSSAYNVQTLQNNSVFPDLQSDEVDMLYSAYGDDTGVQCALRYEEDLAVGCWIHIWIGVHWLFLMSSFTFSLQEFVKGCGSITKRWVDELLDKMTASDHLKAVTQIRQVYGPVIIV